MSDPCLLRRTAILCGLWLCATVPAMAQRPPDIALNPQMNREVVEGIVRVVRGYYVVPEVGEQVAVDLERRLAAGEYDPITSAFDLMDALDAHLQQVSRDAHLCVSYQHKPGPTPVVGQEIPPDTPQDLAADLELAASRNFGFRRVERLPGNIGYLDLASFERPAYAGETAGNAMSFLAGTDALIIDVRRSRGGSPDMVHFLASYFFRGEEPEYLGEWYIRPENRTQQLWTLPYLPGRRYLDRDVYVLVSANSFSAAEGLPALLQHHRRARVVGEKTRGGTHPGSMIAVTPHFAVFVPTCMMIYPTGTPTFPAGRAVHPGSLRDERGTGVQPDIEVPADDALTAARIDALQRLAARHPDKADQLQEEVERLGRQPPQPQPN